MKKIIYFFLTFNSLLAQAQNIEVGLDIALMKVKSKFILFPNEKINTRFGGNIGYRINGNYTFRFGLYNENWDYRYSNKSCKVDTVNKYQICYNDTGEYSQNWVSVPLIDRKSVV